MKPIVFGLSGTSLSDEEVIFFRDVEPHGFILFARNIESRDQLKALVDSLVQLFPERKVEIFIDQEGGRVARIKPPVGERLYPASSSFWSMSDDEASKAVEENYFLLMSELRSFGITATCAPVADIYYEGASNVIGDRSFGSDATRVTHLCRAALNGIERANGIGVIKHIPGHGRATVDSHFDLPIVDTSLTMLEATDFSVFKSLKNTDYAMTAHVIYSSIDSTLPCTLSKSVISYIRDVIGFTGRLITDDISMKALSGDLGELTTLALTAGCDIILHCNGDMREMELIAKAVEHYTDALSTMM